MENRARNDSLRALRSSLPYVLLAGLLLVAAWLRLVGLDWDADQSLHPDERFLTSVETAIRPVENIGDYFDTETSTLNPKNMCCGFYVYGTFPLFLVRYIGEALKQTGWGEINLVGRALSAFMDLGIVFLVFLLAERLYGKRAALVAATFSTFTVMQIQQSHFFTVDNYVNFFAFLALTTACFIATELNHEVDESAEVRLRRWSMAPYLLFGLALGLAAASKINLVVVAFTLPLAVGVRLLRLAPDERPRMSWNAVVYVSIAAVLSLVVFRIAQPYAFNGPTFFHFSLNEGWLDTLRSLIAQQTGDVDWPPSVQWARRPLWFSAQNLILWGMGLPMALMAFGGYFLATGRSLRGEWARHIVLLSWVGFYFIWESLKFNPTMRYQLPSYPGLAVLAGYAVVSLWDWARARAAAGGWRRALPWAAGLLGGAALTLTAIWAFAFVSIYQRPVTRLAATHWIYQNVPGPLTAPIENALGVTNQQLSFPYDYALSPESPYQMQFLARATGDISQLNLKTAVFPPEQRLVILTIYDSEDLFAPLVTATATLDFPDGPLREATLTPNAPLVLTPGRSYKLQIDLAPGQGPLDLQNPQLRLFTGAGDAILGLPPASEPLGSGSPYEATFEVAEDATVAEVFAGFVLQTQERPTQQTLRLTLSANPEYTRILATSDLILDLSSGRADDQVFVFSQSVPVTRDQTIYLRLENITAGGIVTLLGTAIANETNWDDGLPLRTGGYDGYGGIYQRDLHFDIYANSNPQQLERFLNTLDRAEYLAISSSRQWGSTPRIPERFPLNIVYYHNLMGCPEDLTIEQCYNIAQPGMFEENLGFELIQVFQSNPTLGPLEINDQPAEEAFTVYDHPKVFLFKKTEAYSREHAASLFATVDLAIVRHVSPLQAGRSDGEAASLLLPLERLATQQAGGTWRELFNVEGLMNRSQPLTVILWYLFVLLLGWLAYPIVRWALPGLPDRGYPLARGFGLLLLAYFVWLGGSLGIPTSRPMILAVLLLLGLVSMTLVWRQREELALELRQNWSYFLRVEALFLGAFLFMLFVRLGNPELWHPGKGGEKPMDFAYFNAILKSATFPPYDPWFAGGYINYYYWGFVYVGVPVKLLGIVPSLAYNLILPTLVGLLSLGVFSAVWNIYEASREPDEAASRFSPYLVALAGSLAVVFLGNLGSLRMIFRGFAQIGSQGAYDVLAPFWLKLPWAVRGLYENLFNGVGLPFGRGDWYWIPSRVIPAPGDVEPITEFPWFTFTYADLHAHMIALPVTLLALGFVLAVLFGRGWRGQRPTQIAFSLLLGGIAIGSLRPINTWDLPTYLALAAIVIGYAVWRNAPPPPERLADRLPEPVWRAGLTLAAIFALTGLSFLFFKPYGDWYVQGYSEMRRWTGSHTPLGAYFTHWGVWLFMIVSWLAWETRQWLAATPLSALRDLKKYTGVLTTIGLLTGLTLIILHGLGVRIHWLAIPLALWVTALLLRPGLPEAKRLVLFLLGTGLFLTLMVEIIVLAGDIGRMNTVFKFYLQVWVLFGISAAAAFGWTVSAARAWLPPFRTVWQVGLGLLVASAALFTLLGTAGKIADRYTPGAPLTLDGMDYMPYATYVERDTPLVLAQDHAAILWLQQNVDGSPVIVEAKVPGEYRWGSRISINTGLPAVLGWQWHQIQQRQASPPGTVEARAVEIEQFYNTIDPTGARAFLNKYNVQYIIVGQLEQATYQPEGLDKFERYAGQYWRAVFTVGDLTIYEVLDAGE